MRKNSKKSGKKTNSIFVRIDPETALKLSKLGYMHDIEPDIIKRLVDHAHVCDKWWLERDGDNES